jgi:hypothetical protein
VGQGGFGEGAEAEVTLVAQVGVDLPWLLRAATTAPALTRGLVRGTGEFGPPPPFEDSGPSPAGSGGGEDHRACALGSFVEGVEILMRVVAARWMVWRAVGVVLSV